MPAKEHQSTESAAVEDEKETTLTVDENQQTIDKETATTTSTSTKRGRKHSQRSADQQGNGSELKKPSNFIRSLGAGDVHHLEESVLHVKNSRIVSGMIKVFSGLQRRVTALSGRVRSFVLFWLSTARYLYFPDEVNLYTDTIIRLIFSAYYIPALLVTLAMTNSALQRIVWVLVIPVTREMEMQTVNSNYWSTLVMGLWHIMIRLLPFLSLGAAVATVGHKVMNSILEAMIDAYASSRYNASSYSGSSSPGASLEAKRKASGRNYGKMDYPLLHTRIEFITRKRSRMRIFGLTLCCWLAILYYMFESESFYSRSSESVAEDYLVLAADYFIVLVQVCYFALTAVLGAPDTVVDKHIPSASKWGKPLKNLRKTYTETTTALNQMMSHDSMPMSTPNALVAVFPNGNAAAATSPNTGSASTPIKFANLAGDTDNGSDWSSNMVSTHNRSGDGAHNNQDDDIDAPFRVLQGLPHTSPAAAHWQQHFKDNKRYKRFTSGPQEGNSGNNNLGGNSTPPLTDLKLLAPKALVRHLSKNTAGGGQKRNVSFTLKHSSNSVADDDRSQHSSRGRDPQAATPRHSRTFSDSSDGDSTLFSSSSDSERAAMVSRDDSGIIGDDGMGGQRGGPPHPDAFMELLQRKNAESILFYLKGEWWVNHIYRLRYIAFALIVLIALLFGALRGPVEGCTTFILLLTYLNLPHLIAYTALSFSSAIVRCTRSFQWVMRHPDCLSPCCVVLTPYASALLFSMYYFRNHIAIAALLLGIAVLLAARAVDLVREYDVSVNGSVHWMEKKTKALLPPYLATVLEDAYEKRDDEVNIISLDLSFDLHKMQLQYVNHSTHNTYMYNNGETGTGSDSGTASPLTGAAKGSSGGNAGNHDNSSSSVLNSMSSSAVDNAGGVVVKIARVQVYPYGTGKRFLTSGSFYAYTLPRLLTLQSAGYFGGAKFRNARIALRIVTLTLLLILLAIAGGAVVQAAFPNLRPIPVRVTVPPDGTYLTFDHIFVRLNLMARTLEPAQGCERSDADLLPPIAPPLEASDAFKWNVIKSREGEDFYPGLCKKDYYGVSVWELSLLAMAAYLYDEGELRTMLRFINEKLGSDWKLVKNYGRACRATDSNHQPTDYRMFFEVYSERLDVSVVSVRGTDPLSLSDFLMDINIFFETTLYEVLTMLLPGTQVFPKERVAEIIRMASLPPQLEEPYPTWDELVANATATESNSSSSERLLRCCQQNNYNRDFFADIYNHLAYRAQNHNKELLEGEHDGGSAPCGRGEAVVGEGSTEKQCLLRPGRVLVTGHSLGGSVATIIAAQLHLDAVVFASPGMTMSRKRFNIDLPALHKYPVSIISSNDIVPSFGRLGGEVHHVECLAAMREMCHAVEFIVGTLWRSCSSIRERHIGIEEVV